jgi:hypothetical protein
MSRFMMLLAAVCVSLGLMATWDTADAAKKKPVCATPAVVQPICFPGTGVRCARKDKCGQCLAWGQCVNLNTPPPGTKVPRKKTG